MSVRHSDLKRLAADVGELVEKHSGSAEDFSAYTDDPLGFVRDVLDVTDPGLWSGQIDVVEAVRGNPLVVVRGCNGAGKDFVSACIALWWVYCRDGLALLTGPTERQVREILMREVARLWTRSGRLHGDLFTMALRLSQDEEQSKGILAFTSRDASRLTGFHAPNVLVVLTEAQGLEDFVFQAALACAVGEDDRILAVGNPLTPSGRFYDISQSGTWQALKLAASEHPNVVEGRTVIPGAVSRQSCERIASEYGRGSGTYRSRVEGEFPDQGEESLYRRSWLDEAALRHESGSMVDAAKQTAPVVSVDPARYGPDATALAVRRGPILERIETWRGASLTETVARVLAEVDREGVTQGKDGEGRIVVDSVGLGAGVVDQLRDKGYNVTAYNGGQFTKSADRKRFLNERARSYWRLRELLESGDIALPDDAMLFDELMAVNWTPTSDGKVQIEAKSALKGRLGRSPDRADAVVMAFAVDAAETGAFSRYCDWVSGAPLEPTLEEVDRLLKRGHRERASRVLQGMRRSARR